MTERPRPTSTLLVQDRVTLNPILEVLLEGRQRFTVAPVAPAGFMIGVFDEGLQLVQDHLEHARIREQPDGR